MEHEYQYGYVFVMTTEDIEMTDTNVCSQSSQSNECAPQVGIGGDRHVFTCFLNVTGFFLQTDAGMNITTMINVRNGRGKADVWISSISSL